MELKSSIILNDATITAASNGCSIDGTTIKLGHTAAGSGLSDFTANRYLYTAGFALQIGGTAGANLFNLSGTSGSLTLAFDMYVSGIRAGIGHGSVATNTIFGKDALLANTTGYTNTAIGYQTLYTNISGYDNTAIGYYALKANRYGYRNTAVGYSAGFSIRDGYGNTALGLYSLFANNDGYYNTAIGYQALESNIDGYNNTAIGWQAGDYTISGAGNTFPTNSIYIGSSSKSFTNTASNEIVIGYNANGLGSNKATYGNTSIVRHHLNGTPPATSQYGLLTLGSGAFDGSTSGFFTGSATGTGLAMNLASGSTSDLMNLQIAGSSKFNVLNNGNVGIGTATPIYKLHVSGTETVGYFQSTYAARVDIQAGNLSGGTGLMSLYAGTNNNSYIKMNGTYLREGNFGLFVGGTNTSPNGILEIGGVNSVSTTVDVNILKMGRTFNPASGTAAHTSINITPTYNQTGSALGTITGIDYNPTTTGVLGAHYAALFRSGNVGIGTATPVSKLHIGVAPTGSANYGLVSLGSGAFDGSTSGFFTGSASGTLIAGNLASGFAGNLIDLQVGGVSQAKISNTGLFTNTGGIDSLYIRFGSGTPEGVVTAPIGAIFSRTDGGASTSFYVKESGTGNTGWVAK